MYFDDSHTEAKVTDVTHCDLETKSILKPPKTRAPLQEVDLGNHTTVEFDVIRKRRVSFAGVNRIKEFNSEAKSFSICSTPAYEEKVSTSSDSSALSTSVSGNINSLSKENDITILDDTMDLTDLSIVQLSAMDITGLKPQKPSQGVPDIFAPRSKDSDLFSSQQGINRPAFSYEVNKPNVKESSPSQSEPEKSNKPEGTPLALDPRQMLLKELLEESVVDCSVDNYLKANTLFAQNNYNVGDSCKTEIKKPFEVSEMDFTQAFVDPIKPESHHFQPVLEKKDLDNEQIHAKITSCKPPDVSGVDMDQSILQNIVLTENECPKSLQNLKQSHTFPNFKTDESKTTKIDASQMEFTEALPSKNFNLAQNNLAASNYIADRLLARANTSSVEQFNLAKMKSNTNLNLNSNESRSGNSNISQMEFTEALPTKNIVKQDLISNIHSTGSLLQNMQTKPFQNLMPNHMPHDFNVDESKSGNNNASQMEFTEALSSKNTGHQNFNDHASSSDLQMKHPKQVPNLIQSHSFPNFNSYESRSENSNVSQMEFTEALPPKHVVHQNLVYHASSSVSQIELPKQLSKHIVPNFNLNESRLENSNVSQMEFTEALPSKKTGCQNFIDHTSSSVSQIEHEKQFPKSIPSHRIPNFNIGESRSGNSNLSQMEFKEALPTKNIGGQHFIDHTNSSDSQRELPKQIPNSIPNHLIPNFNLDESRVRNCNTSQMEFTEALPSKNVAYSNFKIDGSEQVKDYNTTLMELTEALPPQNANPAFNNIVNSNSIKDGLVDRDNRSSLMALKPSCSEIRNGMIPNLNTDLSKPITCNDTIERDFIEGLSAKPSHNIVVSNYVGELEEKLNISPFMPEKPSLHDIQSDMFLNLNNELFKEMKKNVPKNESQDVPPSLPVDVGPNEVLNNMIEVPKVSQIVHPNPSPNLNKDKSISPENNNASQMEFTEVLLSKKMPLSNNITNQFAENKLLTHTDVFQIEDPKIDLNSEKGNYVNRTDRFSEKLGEASQMELTEAVPMLYINKKQTTSARNSLGFHRNVSQKNVIIDRENIPPYQDLNESNSMDVTMENIMHASESNAKINMNTGNFSDMEFTQGLPASMNDGKTGQKKLDHNKLEKNNALISQKLPGKNVSSAIHNEQNVPNTMNISVIDQHDIIGQLKENENVNRLIMQPTFSLEQSISKDISQMEFTEALPARNIPVTLNFARSAMNLDCEPTVKTKFSPSYNLQTSNMEFTEVLPITKQFTITSKETPESDKIIPSKFNPNDSCSMDITDIENVSENPDKNKVNIISTDFSNVPKSEINKELDDENKSSPNVLFLSGSQNNFVTERKMLGETQCNFSQLEFTEALPVRNELNTLQTENDLFSNDNPFVNNKKSIMVSDENYSDCNTNTQCRNFPQKSDAQHFIFASEDKENKVSFPSNKENVDNLCSDVAGTKNISQESSNVNDELAIQKNVLVDKSEFSHDSGHKNFNLLSKPYENMFPVANQFIDSSVDNTQMDFTETVQPQIKFKDIIKLNADDIVVSEKGSCVLVDSDLDANKIPDASQMEFTEAITMPKCQNDLYQNVAYSKFTNDSSVEKRKAGTIGAKELVRPNVENKLDFIPLASSNIQGNISSNEKEQETKDFKSEYVKIADIDDIQNSENSYSKCSEVESIVNNCPKIFQSYDKINKNSITTTAHTVPPSDIGNYRELNNLNKVTIEAVSSAQNVEVFSPMHVDEPSIPTIRKDNKVESLRKLFENESKSDNSRGEIFTPKGKQFCAVRSTDGTSESSNNFRSASKIVETLTVDDASQKKNLVHFNTPPVRIPKRRKTFGFPDSEESVQLLQSSTSDLALPLQDVSTASNLQNASQRRGIFDDNRKLAYDPEKGKEEWIRLVKNDAFMKERSFHFINPCKWKYEFRWPMVLVLEIPNIEVSENSRKKNISLVSNISDSDHISVFIDNRMKKNMSLILSEKWLNSHCKTIKDLLFTIKFIEEEYNKLEPLISSMKYFYQEFPFDFSSDRIIFKIVNLRKEFCFEIKIDVSYGQVKGKNIDVINHVGEISKTEVQQLFDRLQPNTERFYLFWQKLMEIQ